MLIKLRFAFADIFLGAVAISLMGWHFQASTGQPRNGPSNVKLAKNKNVAFEERLADPVALMDCSSCGRNSRIGHCFRHGIEINRRRPESFSGPSWVRNCAASTKQRWGRPCPCRIRQRWQLPARNIRNAVNIGWSSDGDKEDFEKVETLDPGTIILLPKTQTERGTRNAVPFRPRSISN